MNSESGGHDMIINQPEIIKGHRLANQYELSCFEKVVGTKMLPILDSLGSSLYIDKSKINFPSKDTNPGSHNNFELIGEMFGLPSHYIRTDFATVMNDRVLTFATFQKNPQAHNEDLPDKVVQMEFMFRQDWQSWWKTSGMIYNHQNNYKNAGDSLNIGDASLFSIRVRRLARAINDDCILQVNASNKKRERVYRTALKGMTNVLFVGKPNK